MIDNYDQLMKTFKKQLELIKELIVLSDRKTHAIRENDTTAIMDITNKEEAAAREIILLEKTRDVYIKEIERIEKIKIDNITQYVSLKSANRSVGLNFVAEELKYNLEILKEKNKINETLMGFVLEQIEIANNLIIGDRVPSTYSNTKINKNVYNKGNTSYFDNKY